jgi:hypothetical protein
MFRGFIAFRLIVVVASMLALLAARNHCVFAAPPMKQAAAQSDMPSDCPMHAKQQPSHPQKQNGCGDLPCCKNFQATATSVAKLVGQPVCLRALITFFTPAAACATPDPRPISSFDTGPPGESSFAELVLQRSILAHAPPV